MHTHRVKYVINPLKLSKCFSCSVFDQTNMNQKDKIKHCVVVSLQVVDHLLLGDEMRGLVDQRHERVEFVRPVVEQVVGVLGPLEVDDAGQAVHLGVDGLVHDEAGEELLGLLAKRAGRQDNSLVCFDMFFGQIKFCDQSLFNRSL